MTSEFGPRDEHASLTGRLFGLSTRSVLAILNRVGDSDVLIRYDSAKASLSLSGESENSGDAYRRGQLVFAVVTLSALLPIAALMGLTLAMNGVADLYGTTAALPFALGVLGLLPLTLLNLSGMASVVGSISVVDHTTEPTPDALDDLKERYQNGEIDEDQLEREAAEVWDR